MTPMTLPRSLTLVALAASMHSAMNVSSSASDERLRQVGLQHFDLGLFFVHEIRRGRRRGTASARVLALLDHALDDGLHAGIVERPARIDLALLDARKRHAQAR